MLDRLRKWVYGLAGMEDDEVMTAADIACYFIDRAHKSGSFLTNLKLQKLLYYAQGWHLGLFGKPLFPDPIEAWVHGPVVRSVYRRYKDFGWSNIDGEVKTPILDQPLTDYFEELCRAYFYRDAYELELMTHREEPWITARGDLAPDVNSNREITQDSMRKFFASRAGSA